MKKDVGIVMPIYKQEPQYLKLALKSILRQSYPNYYLVIVFDGAPVETRKAALNIINNDSRVSIITKKKNEGVSKALNTGFDYIMRKMEEVEYLTWVSSDNIYYPPFLERLRAKMKGSPENIGLVYSSFHHIDENGNKLKEPSRQDFIQYQKQPKEKLLNYCFIGVSFLYKKSVAKKISGYYFEPVEDYDYWLRLTEYCDIAFIPEFLMEYRMDSPQSISAQLKSSPKQQRWWRYMFIAAKMQARKRRNIPLELSIIFPVNNGSEKTIEKLEKLLDQSFCNYQLFIIDYTRNKEGMQVLKHISDPRIKFVSLPGKSRSDAIRKGIELANTPFSLLYGEGNFPLSTIALEKEMDKKNVSKIMSLNFGKIYRTVDLKTMLMES